jgi:1-acyl-sn-glycerol-3-phosphate acyltransferase
MTEQSSAQINKNVLLVLWRVPAILFWMMVMPLLFMTAKALRVSGYTSLPHVFHAGVRRILGLRVTFTGTRSSKIPTLFVSNHISYLDVFVLGDIRAYFIAKSEVANWPVLGKFARFQNTLFFERKTGRAKQQIEFMQAHLKQGRSLILFPEGTSTNGVHVEPFKSSLFEAANLQEHKVDVAIQPVTITYTHQAGEKMNQTMLDHYAWYNLMPFFPHFAALFALKKADVKVHFHPVCYLKSFETRKHCADVCQQNVAEKMAEFWSGA